MSVELKLVDQSGANSEVLDPTAGYEPLFLTTVELLDAYWPQTAAVLHRCVDEAMHGEMTLQDIYDGIRAGRLYGLVFKNDDGEAPSVALAIVMEISYYPRYSVLNITALGGHDMALLRGKFWDRLCGWAYMVGVRTMQASVSPTMARMLRGLSFEPVYTTVRLDLTELAT